MSTPSSSAEPGPDREAHGAGGASAPVSPDFTVANRLSFSSYTVAPSATPGAVFLGSRYAGRIDGSAPVSSRGSGKRQMKQWGVVVLALALAAAALAGYGLRGWHEGQNIVEPRGYAQVDKGFPGPPETTQPLAAHVPVVTRPASTNPLLSDFEKPTDDAASPQQTPDLKAELATHAASHADAKPAVTGSSLSGRGLWPADDGAGKADRALPASGTATRSVASAQQVKPGKTAAPVTRQAPVSGKTPSCPAELSALQLCPLLPR